LTPEQKYLLGLKNLGHEVMVSEVSVGLPANFMPDVIVAMSEVTCENGYMLAKAYNLPFYAHMEWIPKWRVFIEPESWWGIENTYIPYVQKMNFIRRYQAFSYFWGQADYKTLAADCFHDDMKYFIGQDFEIGSKKLGVDTELIKKWLEKNPDVKENNEITCIARFVPHKRIHHIIAALKYIEFVGVLNLVGYGPEKEKYENMKENINIKYWDSKDKYLAIAQSKFVIALWSGLVPAEASYLGKTCLTYDSKYMRELFGDNIYYANNNMYYDLASNIKSLLSMPESERYEKSLKCMLVIEKGKGNTLTFEESIKHLEGLIIKAIENKGNTQ